MSLLIRREVDEVRIATVFELGELVYSTDGRKLYIGDGITRGGINVIEACVGAGLTFDPLYQTINAVPSEGEHIPRPENREGKFLTTVDGALRWQDISQVPPPAAASGKFLGVRGTELVWDEPRISALKEPLRLNGQSIIGPGSIGISGIIDLVGDMSVSGTLNVQGTSNLYNVSSYSSPSKIDTAITGYSITNGTPEIPAWIEMVAAKGSWNQPVDIAPGDFLGGFKISARIKNLDHPATVLVSELLPTANIDDYLPASNFRVAVSNGKGVTQFSFGSSGVFEAPVVNTGSYTTAELPTNLKPGSMVFDSESKQFKGWTGTDWVVLG